jgi:hypothetical protein
MAPAAPSGMARSSPRNDHDTTERVERYERERIVERPAYTTPASASNVNVGPTAVVARNDAVWAVTRIVALLFTVLEPSGPPVLDLAALLAVAFFFLIAALIVAIVRAITAPRAT